MIRNIRELELSDINKVTGYFLNADHESLNRMGVNPDNLPQRDTWNKKIAIELNKQIEQRDFHFLIWEIDGTPVGHSNISNILFGEEAYMHLHIWDPTKRYSGNGTYFVEKSASEYFSVFKLNNLCCEPYSLNPGPNKTLQKAGFEFIKTYEKTPGPICSRQTVNRWALKREKWINLIK